MIPLPAKCGPLVTLSLQADLSPLKLRSIGILVLECFVSVFCSASSTPTSQTGYPSLAEKSIAFDRQ
jgi:hypothetical protein